MNDAFGRQVAAYRSGGQYMRTSADTPYTVSDSRLRQFAMNAYTPSAKRGTSHAGMTYVPGLSSAETAVYINPATRNAVIAFRGSATRADFLDTDVKLATGKLTRSARFQRTAHEYSTAVKALAGYDVHTTGHSLGASLGEALSTRSTVPVAKRHVSFNPGYGAGDVLSDRSASNVTSYRNRMDLISYLGKKKAGDVSYRRGYLLSAHRGAPRSYVNNGL